MSERSLDQVVRTLRQAESYLSMAEKMSDTLLQNHVVASDILDLRIELKNYMADLNTVYRRTHFG